MLYSSELELFTTWLMVGGGILLMFSLLSCVRYFSAGRKMGLAKTIALVGFWLSFYGAYMDPRFAKIW